MTGQYVPRLCRLPACFNNKLKLDAVDYSEKLTAILSNNNVKCVTIVRMEVPCCCGLQYAAEQALMASGKFIPWQVVTISTEGQIIE